MHYAPQFLLCCVVWISTFTVSLTKPPLDPELIKKYAKDVETVLSPTLIGELQGAQSNRSSVNVEQTAPRNPEQPRGFNDQKPNIQFDNRVYPYHYESSYHYQYPPRSQDDLTRPAGYSREYYEPRNQFRSNSPAIGSNDPTHYRSELYSPFDSSSSNNARPPSTSNLQSSSNLGDNRDISGDEKPTGRSAENDQGPTDVRGGTTPQPPPNSFPHPDIRSSHPPFPSVNFDSYRHGIFGRPLPSNNYFRSSPDGGHYQHSPHSHGHYLPQGEGSFSDSLHQRPIESYQHLPPLDSFDRPSVPASAPRESQYLPPPFLGPFYPSGYQSPILSNYRPSQHFNNLFSDNFTRDFPLRSSFGGFYPNRDYLPSPLSPSPSPTPTQAETKPGDNAPAPGGPLSQPIPTTKPNDAALTPAASNSNYNVKLFFPTRDDFGLSFRPTGAEEFLYYTENLTF